MHIYFFSYCPPNLAYLYYYDILILKYCIYMYMQYLVKIRIKKERLYALFFFLEECYYSNQVNILVDK